MKNKHFQQYTQNSINTTYNQTNTNKMEQHFSKNQIDSKLFFGAEYKDCKNNIEIVGQIMNEYLDIFCQTQIFKSDNISKMFIERIEHLSFFDENIKNNTTYKNLHKYKQLEQIADYPNMIFDGFLKWHTSVQICMNDYAIIHDMIVLKNYLKMQGMSRIFDAFHANEKKHMNTQLEKELKNIKKGSVIYENVTHDYKSHNSTCNPCFVFKKTEVVGVQYVDNKLYVMTNNNKIYAGVSPTLSENPNMQRFFVDFQNAKNHVKDMWKNFVILFEN